MVDSGCNCQRVGLAGTVLIPLFIFGGGLLPISFVVARGIAVMAFRTNAKAIYALATTAFLPNGLAGYGIWLTLLRPDVGAR